MDSFRTERKRVADCGCNLDEIMEHSVQVMVEAVVVISILFRANVKKESVGRHWEEKKKGKKKT